MRDPDALRRRLRSTWARQRQAWLAGEGRWPLALAIQPPTEAEAAAQWSAFGEWLARWRHAAGEGEVEWLERNWPRLGAQRLPNRWRFGSAAAVARELGEGARWQNAQARFDELAALPSLRHAAVAPGAWSRALARSADLLADLADSDYPRLRDVLIWLLDHPDSGLYLRQVPIAGIDSKWVEPYRGVLGGWLAAWRGGECAAEFHAASGLRPLPDRLRLRLLDPHLRAQVGGLSDLAAPIDALAQLRLPARHVLIVENLVTGLALDDAPGTVVLMARGYAIEAAAQLDWVRTAAVSYWGDLDLDGLAILDRLRQYLPQVRSLMMDEATLLAFRELCVEDTGRKNPPECLERLTEAEHMLYDALRSDRHGRRLRLEQERIRWDWAWARVRSACGEALASGVGSHESAPPAYA